MEHSALHALLLTGLIVALGGPAAVLWLLQPAARAAGIDSESGAFACHISQTVARWTSYGALAATLATFVDFFVQIAELQGETVFGGTDFSMVIRFATHTTVGQLCLARVALLLLTAGAARLPGRRHWWLVLLLAWSAVIASSLVSHAAAQPDHRALSIAAQVTHITTAALWMGVLLHLFVARKALLADTASARVAFVADVVRRFSPIALATTSLLGITGVLSAFRYLSDPTAIFTSAYGLTLVVKLALLAPAIYAGYINFKIIRPALNSAALASEGTGTTGQASGIFTRFSKTLELEITAGLLVITVAGILGSVSPPGDDGSQRLTAAQTSAVLSPHRPTTDVSAWYTPDDPRGPTIGDLHYSEFTHNWSGVTVCLLGLAWLAQAAGGRAGVLGARCSAFLLIPFGCFVAVAANPELWVLHQVSPWEALTNPILLEHQIGAAMVFILAWLTWRDRKNPAELRPLGYALPVLMITGSLLLLGHAHSTTSIPDDLTNLINVQHAVFGALGLFAGTARLLILRRLLPPVPALKYFWPACVITLGLFMAFVYREAV